MDSLAPIIFGLLGIALLWFVLVYPSRLRFKGKLKRMSTVEIEAIAYNYARDYFVYLGEGNESVQEFKDLVERQDLLALVKNWKRLSRSFRRLEIAAGHTGRPALLDYYCEYEMVLQELKRRKSKTGKL